MFTAPFGFVGFGVSEAVVVEDTGTLGNQADYELVQDWSEFPIIAFQLCSISVVTNQAFLLLVTTNDGGTTWDDSSSNYRYRLNIRSQAGGDQGPGSNNSNNIRLGHTFGSASGWSANDGEGTGWIYMYAHNDSAAKTLFGFDFRYRDPGSTHGATCWGYGQQNIAEVNDGIRFNADTGNMAAGRVITWGFRQ